jgi:DNA-binding beta-propeller fold protein YncE
MSRSTRASAAAVLAIALAAAAAAAAPAGAAAPVTPAGWRVDPAGGEVAISRVEPGFQGPLGAALSADGGRLLAAGSGAARIDSADLFDLAAGQRTSYVAYDATKPPGEAAFFGVAWAPDDKRGLARRAVMGFIPTAWYPAAVSVTPDGKQLVVTNTNASGAGPNRCGGL